MKTEVDLKLMTLKMLTLIIHTLLALLALLPHFSRILFFNENIQKVFLLIQTLELKFL